MGDPQGKVARLGSRLCKRPCLIYKAKRDQERHLISTSGLHTYVHTCTRTPHRHAKRKLKAKVQLNYRTVPMRLYPVG